MRSEIRQAIQSANERATPEPVSVSRDVAIVLAEQRLMRNAGMIVREMVKQQIPLADAEDVFRSMYVNAALEVAKGRKTRAAKLLGVHRNTMYRRGA